jgi:hypothetical protein
MIATRARLSCLAVFAFAALAGAGCGESEEEKVQTAVKDYAAALRDKDFDKACEGLSERSRKQVEQAGAQAGGDCPAILKQVADTGSLGGIPKPDDVEFESVEVDGDTAAVEIKGGDAPAQLRKQDGEWKFDFGQGGGGGGSGGGSGGGGGNQGGGQGGGGQGDG